jgi:maleylacetate reductase
VIRELLPGNVPSVHLGAGAIDRVVTEIDGGGFRRALVLSTPRRTALAARVSSLLAARSLGLLAIAEEHVPMDVARRGRVEATARGADVLVAVGGGSTVGLAKAIALEHGLPYVALPTTFSGSEMTPVWGITEGAVKRTGRDERVRARAVLYDPALSVELPPSVAVPSAFNALAHAVEAAYAPEATPELLDLAESAVRCLGRGIPALVARSKDLGLRELALEGACYAGACLSRASMGLHHKLCHVLGGTFGLSHAATHAVLLPYVARFNLEAAKEASARLARALGSPDPAGALLLLAKASGVPRSLADVGLSADAIDRAAALVTAAPYPNPRPVSAADVRAVLEAALRGW